MIYEAEIKLIDDKTGKRYNVPVPVVYGDGEFVVIERGGGYGVTHIPSGLSAIPVTKNNAFDLFKHRKDAIEWCDILHKIVPGGAHYLIDGKWTVDAEVFERVVEAWLEF